MHILNKHGTNATTSCENVANIGLVTLEFNKQVYGIFFAKTAPKMDTNWHIPSNISATT